ncbi:MAG: hypothetical protein AABM29_10570 [Actinomycetota bacterium]
MQRALELQHGLADDVGMRNAPWVGTHNSFNSTAEMGQTLSAQDSNQELAITDQLDLGIRSVELDVHWFLSLQAGGLAPVVCHARSGSEAHAGCSIEKPLREVLDEIAGWLRKPANRRAVLLLYLEDHLDNQTGYDTAASVVAQRLGGLLYQPAPGGCRRLPSDLNRRRVLASGAQVVIVSDCGVGSGWPSVIFDWDAHKEERPHGFTDYPDCGPDFKRIEFDNRLIRYYEDSTQLTANAGSPDDGIKPRTASQMARCGVDLVGLDQLTRDDSRLAALVWSWAQGQPGSARCAVQQRATQGLETPWRTRPCRKRRRPACRRGDVWVVAKHRVRQRKGRAGCRKFHARFAVPRTGYEAQLLRRAMKRAGTMEVWLGYRRSSGGDWVVADARG